MADNRGTRIPPNQPGFGYGMMPGMPGQYCQPGMQGYPMMQQPMMMSQGMAPQMFQMQQIPMVQPPGAPPPYNPHMAERYKSRAGGRGVVTAMTEEERRKAEYFQAQKQRLKQFGKGVPGTTFIPDDPTKLVDSIFGTNSAKPKPKSVSKSEPVQTKEDEDDGFGDFIEGPSVKTQTEWSTTPSQAQSQSGNSGLANSETAELHNPKDPELHDNRTMEAQNHKSDKKDLMSMMMECSDLKQPAKARNFQKPSLKEVHVSHAQNKTYQQSDHSRCWSSTDELIGLFKSEIQSQPAPVQVKVRQHSGSKRVPTTSAGLPMWVEASNENLPAVYTQVLEAASGPNGIETDRLYPILLLSGLPREVLGNIWQLANRETPGQVTRAELFAILALIALAQNNYSVAAIEILTRCPQPPVPFLGQNAVAPVPVPDPAAAAAVAAVAVVVASSGMVTQIPNQPLQILTSSVQSSMQTTNVASHAVTSSGQVVPGPGQIVPGAGQVVPGPGQVVPGPGQIVPSPGQFVHGTGQIIPGSGQASPGPAQVIPCSGQGPIQPLETASQIVPGSVQVPGQVFPGGGQMVVQSANRVLPNYGQVVDNHTAVPGVPGPVIQDSVIGPSSFPATQGTPAPPLQNLPMTDVTSQPYPRVTMTSVVSSMTAPTAAFHASEVLPQNNVPVLPHPNSQHQTITSAHPPHSSLGDDDEFADFQTATVPVQRSDESFSDYISSDKKKEIKQTNLPETVPVSMEFSEQVSYDDKYNSNIRSFFCSSDSSTAECSNHSPVKGHTTPNSLEDDFTDCRDSSQLSTSEQSENEDIKVFESYVEEFNRKKDQQNFSPLHRPIAKRLPATPSLPAESIPHVPPPQGDDFTDFKSAPATTTTTAVVRQKNVASKETLLRAARKLESVSAGPDDEFSEFQAAPVKNVKPSPSGPNLLGDEDKYSALRSVDVLETAVFDKTAEPAEEGFANFEEVEKNDDDWAPFAEAGQEQNSPAVPGLTSKGSLPQLGDAAGPANQSGLKSVDSAPVLTSNVESQTKSAVDTTSFFKSVSSEPESTKPTVEKDSILSLFGSEGKKDDDDWADFATAPATNSNKTFSVAAPVPRTGQALFSEPHSYDNKVGHLAGVQDRYGEFIHGNRTLNNVDETDNQRNNAPDSSPHTENPTELLTVKKTNLPSDEIMGVFKMREDPSHLAKLKRPSPPKSESSKSVRLSSQESDTDDDRLPPPMDFPDEEEDHIAFSRGYDGLDEIVNKPVVTTSYNPYGITTTSLYTSAFSKKQTARTVGSGLGPLTDHPVERIDDDESSSSKDQDSWKDRPEPESREDSQSISSLDLNHRITASHKDSDSGGTDSQSVSSAEFGSFDVTSRGPVESKSVDSLDLKNEPPPDDETQTGYMNSSQLNSGLSYPVTVAPKFLISGRMKPLADRYNIGDEVQGNNNHEYEWERCLDNCCRMIQDANTVFNSVSSSVVCNEVIRSAQGSEYVTAIVEIYKVVCRIMAAMMSSGIKTPTLEKLLKEIDLSWNNLTAFLMGASILPDPQTLDFFHAVIKSDSDTAQQKCCGVCLLNVDVKDKGLNDDNGVAKLTYGGRQYHAPCANFWVNCVDSTLPALRLPELL